MPSTNGHGPKRAAIYVRVSTDEQGRSGYSIPEQLRELRAYAAREGYETVEEAVDDGYSGTNPHRPGLQRVLELAQAGAIDVVLAMKRDRLFRSRLYRLLWDRDLQECGVQLVALNDTGNRFGDAMQDEFAEWEKEEITKRTRAGREGKARKGKILKGKKPPYGFRYNEAGDALVIHEPEMLVVERIYRMAAEGLGPRAIKSRLWSEGVP